MNVYIYWILIFCECMMYEISYELCDQDIVFSEKKYVENIYIEID